jgi:hypothetical protein
MPPRRPSAPAPLPGRLRGPSACRTREVTSTSMAATPTSSSAWSSWTHRPTPTRRPLKRAAQLARRGHERRLVVTGTPTPALTHASSRTRRRSPPGSSPSLATRRLCSTDPLCRPRRSRRSDRRHVHVDDHDVRDRRPLRRDRRGGIGAAEGMPCAPCPPARWRDGWRERHVGLGRSRPLVATPQPGDPCPLVQERRQPPRPAPTRLRPDRLQAGGNAAPSSPQTGEAAPLRRPVVPAGGADLLPNLGDAHALERGGRMRGQLPRHGHLTCARRPCAPDGHAIGASGPSAAYSGAGVFELGAGWAGASCRAARRADFFAMCTSVVEADRSIREGCTRLVLIVGSGRRPLGDVEMGNETLCALIAASEKTNRIKG